MQHVAPGHPHGRGGVMRPVAVWLYRGGWMALIAVALLLVICSTPAFAHWLRRGLTDGYPTQPAADYPTADAIVVLGGGWMRDAEDVLENPSGNDAYTRLGFGRELYEAGRAPLILLSGGKGEARRMAANLALLGVPAQHMLIESRSRNTHENALFSAPMLRRAGATRILLVTSGIHIGRATAAFRKQGVEVIPAPALPFSPSARHDNFWHARKRALAHSADFLREYFGRWFYRLRGWT